MTIEFYKRKRDISAWRRDTIKSLREMRKNLPKERRRKFDRDMAYHRKHLKIVKVKVVDSRKLDHAGGRKYGGRGPIRKGEVGYVFAWRGMKKDAGLQRVTRRR